MNIVIVNHDLEINDGWLPRYLTDGAAGIDLRAMFNKEEFGDSLTLHANESILISSGFKIDISDITTAGVILPRSGLGAKKGIICGNAVGLIDSDYLGEVFISVWNRTDNSYSIEYGERIAQMIFIKVERAELNIVSSFDKTTGRGEGGFGHSGRK